MSGRLVDVIPRLGWRRPDTEAHAGILSAPIADGSRGLRLGELLRRGAISDGDLVEPAAARTAGRPVEPRDVRLDVDDRSAVQKVDPGEHDGLAGYVEKLDEAEPDGVDPPRAAASEDAHLALLV